MIALTDLGPAHYLGFVGGLYPEGANRPPSYYEEAGAALGGTVLPVGADGAHSASGKVVMACIGMSNASRQFTRFMELAASDSRTNSHLVMVNAAQDGVDALSLVKAEGSYWRYVDRQLRNGGMTAAQVQVVWLKTALAYHLGAFPDNARILQEALRAVINILKTTFPHLKQVYISSRTFGGYSKNGLSPEPAAYESGFAVKWLVEERLRDFSTEKSLPWISWGPYLWADGLAPRGDGLIWERSDFEPDGVHPSPTGALKVANALLEFFQRNSASRPWFSEQSYSRD